MASDDSSFVYKKIGESAQESGLPSVPDCHLVPLEQLEPTASRSHVHVADVPIIDLSGLTEQRSAVVNDIGNACRLMGFFQIINHGISEHVMNGALSVASAFFELPAEEKEEYMSNDVHKPVRYGTSLKDGLERTQYWRVFLKQYANPLEDWLLSWPHNPPTYREKMGKYSALVRKVAMELTAAITESLGIGPTYLTSRMEGGMQVVAVNGYPPCPNPGLSLGLPPHSDYSVLTVLLQSSPGLQILDPRDRTWKLVPVVRGALQVHVGDHLEVLSNGLYKGILHRAVLNEERFRISIASLHSLGLDEKMETAPELVSRHNPRGYRGSSFQDFLDFLSSDDSGKGKSFIDTLRINS